jgi:hypothetical protein
VGGCSSSAPGSSAPSGKHPSRPFLAALLRRVHDAPEARIRQAERDGYERGRKAASAQADDWKRQVDSLRQRIAEFERASGVRINGWDRGRIGPAVDAVLNGSPERARRELESVRGRLTRLLSDIDQDLSALAAPVAGGQP